jgi:hypothetical protein
MAQARAPLTEVAIKAKGKGHGMQLGEPPALTSVEIPAGGDTAWAIGFGGVRRRAVLIRVKRPRG